MIERLLFWLVFGLFFFLPAGWAKHWLLPQSLVNGVLVDYLMPDFWLQDLLALLIVLIGWRMRKLAQFRKKGRVILGLLLIAGSIFFSSIPLISLIYALRFFLAFLAALILRNLFQKKPELIRAAYQGLFAALVWTTILAMAQLINQGSVLGWWFLGEPIFSLGSGGVKKVEILGKTFVTPLATLPHSNVLAGFAFLCLLVFRQFQDRSRLKRLGLILGSMLLLISFSFYTWVAAGIIFFWRFWPILIPLCGLLLPIFSSPSSLFRRLVLAKIAFKMIADQPLWGVGWGTFVSQLPNYWSRLTLTDRFLQPVHNIFLLSFSELGFLGFLGLWLIISYPSILYTPYSILFLGFFDHYFWTTTQGVYFLFLLPILVDTLKNTRAG